MGNGSKISSCGVRRYYPLTLGLYVAYRGKWGWLTLRVDQLNGFIEGHLRYVHVNNDNGKG